MLLTSGLGGPEDFPFRLLLEDVSDGRETASSFTLVSSWDPSAVGGAAAVCSVPAAPSADAGAPAGPSALAAALAPAPADAAASAEVSGLAV